MNDFFFHKSLERLEKAGNNDYRLIIEFGAEAYSIKELKSLLEKASIEQEISNVWHKKLLVLGFSISLWMAASIFAGIMNSDFWSYAFLIAVPISLFAGLVGHFVMLHRYPNINDCHLVSSIIKQELEWRRQDKLIF